MALERELSILGRCEVAWTLLHTRQGPLYCTDLGSSYHHRTLSSVGHSDPSAFWLDHELLASCL